MLGLEIQNIRMILHESAQDSLAWATIWATLHVSYFHIERIHATRKRTSSQNQKKDRPNESVFFCSAQSPTFPEPY
jgi:hypothetical protein